MNVTRIGILLFLLAVLLGPLYAVENYSMTGGLISHLGAQNTPYNYIMIIGFLALGLGLLIDGIGCYRREAIPFMAFGAFMALAGIFPHMPMDDTARYSLLTHQLHGVFASLAGVSITIGLIWQAFTDTGALKRTTHAVLAILCVALPIAMLLYSDVQGLIQRFMYLAIFAWLWIQFPDNLKPSR
jgi:hypothetical membrane protein